MGQLILFDKSASGGNRDRNRKRTGVIGGSEEIVLLQFDAARLEVAAYMLRKTGQEYEVLGQGYVSSSKKVLAVALPGQSAGAIRSGSIVSVIRNGTAEFGEVLAKVRRSQPEFLRSILG